jgi:pimeloyl-ACP methyl ester carboxylesterase
MKSSFAFRVVASLAASLALLAAGPRPPLVLADNGVFYIPGRYVKTPDGDVMSGAMYVHAMIPARVTKRYPVVFIHGIHLTGATWESTPDGREGIATYFVRAGYAVYVVDQPARGRSAYRPEDGPMTRTVLAYAQGQSEIMAAPERVNRYPLAAGHAQWPGDGPNKGLPGDPVFDQYYASNVEAFPLASGVSERMMKVSGAALLDKIGPAILVTHSQAGTMGWQIADARPGLVKAIVALEPTAFPIASGTPGPPYGVTFTPITFAPAIADPSELSRQPDAEPDAPGYARCWRQAPPARQLPNLRGIAIGLIVAGNSPFTTSIHCTSKWLAQAGVPNDLVRLADVGIPGNGHMLMLEKNSDDIARFMTEWLRKKGF